MGVNGGSTYGLGLDQCSGRHLLDAFERLVDFEHVTERRDDCSPFLVRAVALPRVGAEV